MSLNKYSSFPLVLLEHSKGDKIPELNRIREGMAIIVVGHPGSGKSTFINEEIIKFNKDVKIFILEEISEKRKRYLNTPGSYVRGTKRILLYAMSKYIEGTSRNNLIYETTGMDLESLSEIVSLARNNNYRIMLIHLETSLSEAEARIKKRVMGGGHGVDSEYLKEAWLKNKDAINTLRIKLKPDYQYLVSEDEESGKKNVAKIENIRTEYVSERVF